MKFRRMENGEIKGGFEFGLIETGEHGPEICVIEACRQQIPVGLIIANESQLLIGTESI